MLLDYMMPLLDDVGVLKARCHGYVAFLRKPFEFGALLNAVEQATAGP
jgi:FixJ family two-component response regulator